ncbi:MAG TPA: hypothetical protein VJL78_06240, partial [Candidatus Nitrosocosmicus sp.]|nr:hypothetical protein [Candidatus Nitrosocosmicus sp.]
FLQLIVCNLRVCKVREKSTKKDRSDSYQRILRYICVHKEWWPPLLISMLLYPVQCSVLLLSLSLSVPS